MSDHKSLENRIKDYIEYFKKDGIECDEEFITEQLEEQYPGRNAMGDKSLIPAVIYNIHPTKKARDIAFGLKTL